MLDMRERIFERPSLDSHPARLSTGLAWAACKLLAWLRELLSGTPWLGVLSRGSRLDGGRLGESNEAVACRLLLPPNRLLPFQWL